MSLSPGSILNKLNELKKWQDKQQERLLVNHKQLVGISNSELVRTDALPKAKLKESSVITITAKPKRPFLRRGTGLSRFRMNPGEQFKPFADNKPKTDISSSPLPPVARPKQFQEVKIPTSSLQEPVLTKAVWENASLNETERELAIFETLEKQASNSSFCSTNSNIVNFLSSSTPQKNNVVRQSTDFPRVRQIFENNRTVLDDSTKDSAETNLREKKIQDDYLNLIAKAMKFKNYMDTSLTPSSSLASMNTLQADSFNDKSKWTDFDVGTTESSASSLSSEPDNKVEDVKCDAETMTDFAESELIQKLNVLERELKEVRNESAKGKKIKEQLEQKLREFEQYKKEVTKQIEDERTQIKSVLEEEKKKLAKDKMVFEKYAKDLRNKPSRKEREEIATLKTETATLKETLKLKESRHGTTQARLRNQIKSLEKENVSLKAEIDNLNRQHAKLVVQQRLGSKPSNTKMLHEINKNLSKLAQEQLKKKVETDDLSTDNEEDDKDRVINENDKNSSNTNKGNKSLEEIYQRTFSKQLSREQDRTEQILTDGTKQIKYSNGNIKNVSSDGNIIIFQYFNGDVKETNLLEGTIRYHYSDTKVNHTTNADGSELIQFPDGQIEKRFKSGVCEIDYPNGIKRKIHKDNSEKVLYPDGTIVNIDNDKRVIILPNGQKEIHTDDHKRREYPDGTVKILYPDGIQETRYTNGRLRLKDKYGKLIMDSQQ